MLVRKLTVSSRRAAMCRMARNAFSPSASPRSCHRADRSDLAPASGCLANACDMTMRAKAHIRQDRRNMVESLRNVRPLHCDQHHERVQPVVSEYTRSGPQGSKSVHHRWVASTNIATLALFGKERLALASNPISRDNHRILATRPNWTRHMAVPEAQTSPIERLHEFTARVFQSLGVPEADASLAADVLAASDLRGVDSHGVARLHSYVDMLTLGRINPRPKPR